MLYIYMYKCMCIYIYIYIYIYLLEALHKLFNSIVLYQFRGLLQCEIIII